MTFEPRVSTPRYSHRSTISITSERLHRVVPPEQLLSAALEDARRIRPDSMSAYAASKTALQKPTLDAIAAHPELDQMVMQVVMSPDSVRAQTAALSLLKPRE